MKIQKQAVDLTDLAIGIVVLGIVVSIGATVMQNVADTNDTGSIAQNVANAATEGLGEYANWFKISESFCPSLEESFDASPEYRLKSLRGQDRHVKHKNYALETDKGFQNGMIYSPSYDYT